MLNFRLCKHQFHISFICEQQSLQVHTFVEFRGVNCPRKLSASTSFLGVLGVMRSYLGVLRVLGVMRSVLGVLGVMRALGVCDMVVSLTTTTIIPNNLQNQV